MLGRLLHKLVRQPHTNIATQLHDQHQAIMADVADEVRLVYALGQGTAVTKYTETIRVRYEQVLSGLHSQMGTHLVLFKMKSIAQEVRDGGGGRQAVGKYLRYFEHLSQVRELEKKIVAWYIEAIELMMSELENKYGVKLEAWPEMRPLSTLFSDV